MARYAPIDPNLNASYVPPARKVRSNIVVTPQQLATQAPQPIGERPQLQLRGALSSKPVPTAGSDKVPAELIAQIASETGSNPISEGHKPAAPMLASPQQGFLMNKATPNSTINPNLVVPEQKLNGFEKFVRGANDVAEALQTGSTFGLNKIPEMIAKKIGLPTKEYNPESKAYKVGEFIGSAVPGEAAFGLANLATKGITNNLGRIAARGALGGATYGTARETAEAATGQNDQTLAQRAKDIGFDTTLGIAGDVGLSYLGKGVSNLISRLRSNNVSEETISHIRSLPDNEIVRISELPQQELDAFLNTVNIPERPVITRNQPEFNPETYLPPERIAERTAPAPQAFPVSARIKRKGALSREGAPTAQPAVTHTVETLPPVERIQPAQNERALFSSIESTNVPTPELRERLTSANREYTPITNQETVDLANRRVTKNLSSAVSFATSEGKLNAEKVATGFRALQELQNKGMYEEATSLVENLAEKLTRAGQTVQAASIIQRLSPEGRLLMVQRKVNQINEKLPEGKQIRLTPESAKNITDTAVAAQAARISQERAAEVLNITEKLRTGQQVGHEEAQVLNDFADDLQRFISDHVPDVSTPKPVTVRKRDELVKYLDEKADSAAARIRARRNQLSANPFDTWGDMGIIAAARMAKLSVKFGDFATTMIREFGDEVRPYLRKAYDQGKEVLRREQGRIQSAEAEEAVKAVKVADKYINDNAERMDLQDIDKIRDLARRVATLETDSRIQAEIEMQKILNQYEKSSMWDKVNALRYIAMLLNTGTQAVNALSGPIVASTGKVADLFATMADIAMHATLKTPRTTSLAGQNPLRFMAEWLKGAKVGGKAGWEGVNPSGIAGPNDVRGLTFKSKFNPLSLFERSLGAVAKGADYGTYTAVQKGEIRRMAALDARNKGLKGEAAKRHQENFIANPPPEAMDQADKIARNTTFQRTDSFGGKAANFLNQAPTGVKQVTSTIFPFVRTPVNIAETALNFTPAGIARGLFQLTSKSEASQREALRTIGLGLTGTGFLTPIGYELSKLGLLTGANDSGNKDVDAIREQSGQMKYRFNTSGFKRFMSALLNGEGFESASRAAKFQKGDHQLNYDKLQPIAFPLAVGAGLQESQGEGTAEQLKHAGTNAYGSIYGMSTLKGVQDVFQPSYGGSQGEKALGVPTRILESFLKSFSPSLLAQEARRQDSTIRKTSFNEGVKKDVTDYFKSRTPGLSQSLPPNKTTLGQTKTNAPGVTGSYLNPYQSNVNPYSEAAVFIADLIDKTGNEGLAPKAPDKKVSGRDRVTGQKIVKAIPQERYTKLQEDVGREITELIMSIPDDWNDTRKAEYVEKVYDRIHEKYRNQVKRELGIRVSK